MTKLPVKIFFSFVIMALFLGHDLLYADQRAFAYSYQADSIMPKGQWEFENIVIRRPLDEDNSSRFDVSQEVEYGLTERLTTALYLNSQFTPYIRKFKGITSEWKYMAMSPYLHPIGVMLYGEIEVQENFYELEEKIILQHNMDDWIFVTNFVFEQEFKTVAGEQLQIGIFEWLIGAARHLTHHVSLGVEFRHQSFFDGFSFSNQTRSENHIGPALSIEGSDWFVTLTTFLPFGQDKETLAEAEVKIIHGILL